MKFHDFKTTFDVMRDILELKSPKDYYPLIQRSTMDCVRVDGREGFRSEHNRAVAEGEWYDNGTPYYKVYPAVIPLFSDISIDVPSKYLTLPFSSFVIRFPEEDNPFQLACGRAVQAMIVCENSNVLDGEKWHDERQFYLWIDTGEIDPSGMPVLNYLHLPCPPEMSIEEAFRTLPRDPVDLTEQQAEELLRVAVSICFLATGSDKLVSPDVLSRDLGAWLEAERRRDTRRMETIEQRAVRKGKRGWKIGAAERMYVRPQRQENGDGSRAGYELSYQHQRSCHFRIIPSTGKAKFIRQTTVRADLPPKPIA